MRIFVAGATGAIGRRLVPQLVDRGHQVTGMTRTKAKRDQIEAAGAKAAVADALDPEAVARAVGETEPEVVVHQLTAIPASLDMRNFDRSFVATNRLRREGTDVLLSAARAVGAKRFVAQSFAAWPYERTGDWVKTEDDPLTSNPPKGVTETVAAIRYLEEAVLGAEGMVGIALRYGGFYGPGTSLSLEGEMPDAIRKRKFPIAGGGAATWSFIHIEDAAAATVAAIERGKPGVYNITDDEPAAVSDWLPVLARELGAKPPRRVPKWLARIAAGEVAVTMMTELRGASNEKAKRELDWHPRFASWREGFAHGLG